MSLCVAFGNATVRFGNCQRRNQEEPLYRQPPWYSFLNVGRYRILNTFLLCSRLPDRCVVCLSTRYVGDLCGLILGVGDRTTHRVYFPFNPYLCFWCAIYVMHNTNMVIRCIATIRRNDSFSVSSMPLQGRSHQIEPVPCELNEFILTCCLLVSTQFATVNIQNARTRNGFCEYQRDCMMLFRMCIRASIWIVVHTVPSNILPAVFSYRRGLLRQGRRQRWLTACRVARVVARFRRSAQIARKPARAGRRPHDLVPSLPPLQLLLL